MSGVPAHEAHEAEDARQAWRRVTAWLEHHAPDVLASLGGPGSHAAIHEAELRLGLNLPRQLVQWLLENDIDAPRQPPAGSALVERGCQGVIPSGGLLLGLTDIERVYRHKMSMEDRAPSGDPDYPSWRREWVPIVSESDGVYGIFVNTSTGTVGSWREASSPEDGVHASLSAFFEQVADQLEGASSGDGSGPDRARRPAPRPEDEPVRLWARANGHLVNDRGRIAAAIREAYEASRNEAGRGADS